MIICNFCRLYIILLMLFLKRIAIIMLIYNFGLIEDTPTNKFMAITRGESKLKVKTETYNSNRRPWERPRSHVATNNMLRKKLRTWKQESTDFYRNNSWLLEKELLDYRQDMWSSYINRYFFFHYESFCGLQVNQSIYTVMEKSISHRSCLVTDRDIIDWKLTS